MNSLTRQQAPRVGHHDYWMLCMLEKYRPCYSPAERLVVLEEAFDKQPFAFWIHRHWLHLVELLPERYDYGEVMQVLRDEKDTTGAAGYCEPNDSE